MKVKKAAFPLLMLRLLLLLLLTRPKKHEKIRTNVTRTFSALSGAATSDYASFPAFRRRFSRKCKKTGRATCVRRHLHSICTVFPHTPTCVPISQLSVSLLPPSQEYSTFPGHFCHLVKNIQPFHSTSATLHGIPGYLPFAPNIRRFKRGSPTLTVIL